jgi:hypothetical protein
MQVLSMDAFKYATQSPPLTMVTKTLMNNKRLMADHNYSCEFPSEPNEDQEVPELEKTKQIILK